MRLHAYAYNPSIHYPNPYVDTSKLSPESQESSSTSFYTKQSEDAMSLSYLTHNEAKKASKKISPMQPSTETLLDYTSTEYLRSPYASLYSNYSNTYSGYPGSSHVLAASAAAMYNEQLSAHSQQTSDMEFSYPQGNFDYPHLETTQHLFLPPESLMSVPMRDKGKNFFFQISNFYILYNKNHDRECKKTKKQKSFI
jgi:hypothetical protein